MKMKLCLMLLGSLMCLGSELAKSQEIGVLANKPLPKGPLLKKFLELDAWTISFGLTQAAAAQRPDPAQISLEQRMILSQERPHTALLIWKKPTWHARFADKSGKAFYEFWSDGKSIAVEQADLAKPIPYFLSQDDDRDYTRIESIILSAQAGRFDGFNFISETNYKGTASIDGVECLVFQEGTTTAWVNAQTREPVRWQDGREFRTFRKVSPVPAVNFPPAVKKLLDAVAIDRSVLTAPIPPGG